MKKMIAIIGVIGFVICIVIMYTTDIGHMGLQRYDASAQLFDMSFEHYEIEDISGTFEKLGIEGRGLYQNYWMLDYFFIVCFGVVMVTIANLITSKGVVRKLLIVVTILRAIFDLVENTSLFYLSIIYPRGNELLGTTASWATTFKFITLYLWTTGVVVILIYLVIQKMRNRRLGMLKV